MIAGSTFAGIEITEGQWKERWPNISPDEVRCKGSGDVIIDPDFMDMVQACRDACDFPFRFTSFYRIGWANAQKSSTGLTGPHTGGKRVEPEPDEYIKGACDIKVFGARAHILLKNAMILGFTGIGVKQHGEHSKRFIHLDNLPNVEGQPRSWVWSYP